MKSFFYGLLLFTCMQNLVFAQDSDAQKSLDSIFELSTKSFELSRQNKLADAIKLSNEILDYEKDNRNDSLRGKAYNVLGISYTILKDSIKGKYYFLKTKSLYERTKDTINLITAYNNLGAYENTINNDHKKSNAYFAKAIAIARLSNNLKAVIHPNTNIAKNLIDIEGRRNNVASCKLAITYLTDALNLVNKSKDKRLNRVKGDIYELLGVANFKIKNYEISEDYFNKALEYAEAHDYLEIFSDVYKDKAILYEVEKQYGKQSEMLKELINIKDSIYKVEKFDIAKKIESEYYIKENEEKLKFIEKEKQIQANTIIKARIYNIILALFSVLLLLSVYGVYKKNKELKLAKIKAEHLSKVKSNFYSEISHELRTPLYAVIELSSLLLKENVNVTHKEYLESLKFSGNHLLSLINNVLQLNKVESGKMKILSLDFNLKNLINNIIESLEYALNDSNNKMHLNYDTTIPEVIVGDSLKLSQVLINLISNAIKFTHNGNIIITIKQVKVAVDEITLFFNVSDDGMGISQEKQKQIFEDFYQEHAKNDKSYKGTGLGLSIVKRIVTAMGGDVKVKSKLNEGASFFFELTFNTNRKLEKSAGLSQHQLEIIKNRKILVVDDNKINQLVTQKVLESLSIKNKVVDSGERAIGIVKEEDFDCILMDLHMPGLDGYEATNIIKEIKPQIPIIALTAAAADEIEEKVKQYKMEGYILKPFITTEFVETLNRVINSSTI